MSVKFNFYITAMLLTPCYSGITVIVGSTVSLLIALTWGGLRFPWSSGHVLAPLIIGSIGLVVFFVYEKIWSGHTVSGNIPICLQPLIMSLARFRATSSPVASRLAGKCCASIAAATC